MDGTGYIHNRFTDQIIDSLNTVDESWYRDHVEASHCYQVEQAIKIAITVCETLQGPTKSMIADAKASGSRERQEIVAKEIVEVLSAVTAAIEKALRVGHWFIARGHKHLEPDWSRLLELRGQAAAFISNPTVVEFAVGLRDDVTSIPVSEAMDALRAAANR